MVDFDEYRRPSDPMWTVSDPHPTPLRHVIRMMRRNLFYTDAKGSNYFSKHGGDGDCIRFKAIDTPRPSGEHGQYFLLALKGKPGPAKSDVFFTFAKKGGGAIFRIF